MWHRVAALLGGRTVAEWQACMTSAEFVDWCAFYSLEPWGSEVENWRMGVLGATVANYSGRSKSRVKPSDFMPQDGKRKRRPSPAELKQRLAADVAKADSNG